MQLEAFEKNKFLERRNYFCSNGAISDNFVNLKKVEI